METGVVFRGGDSITPGGLPAGLDAYFGYGDGRWPDYATIAAQHPSARLFRIAVTAADDGDFLDIENGDASISDAPGWVRRQQIRGAIRPGLYISVARLDALVDALELAGIPRAAVRILSAHYDVSIGAHICAPGCYPALRNTADGTQWVDHGAWDESRLSAAFMEEPTVTTLNRPIIAVAARPQGDGMWLVAQDGGIFPLGAAQGVFALDDQLPAKLAPGHLVVDAASTPTGLGLWVVASDGGVFTFGDARFDGSLPAEQIAPSSQPLST